MKLPEIPKSYIIMVLLVGMIILRSQGIDTFVTAGLGLIAGYLTGSHMEQVKTPAVPLVLPIVTDPRLKAKVRI
jgi:hypothetical protein